MIAAGMLVLSYALMGLGVFFSLASAIGIIRFPDVYTRLHAGTKALTGGALFVLLGAALQSDSWQSAAKILLIAGFLLATNPISTHAIARACYRHGIRPQPAHLDHYGESLEKEKRP